MTTATSPRPGFTRPDTWRSMGKIIDLPVTDKGACAKAGLDWSVRKEDLFRKNMDKVGSHVAVVRSDNDGQLGIVGAGYGLVQNADLFRFMESLNDYGDVILDTAGYLGQGETVWVRGKVKGLSFDIKGDQTDAQLLLLNGHIANMKLGIVPMIERKICSNGMRMVVKVSGKQMNTLATGYSLRHTSGITTTLESIKNAYMKTLEGFKATEEAMRFLAAKPLDNAAIARLFGETWEKPATVDQKSETADLEALAEDESARAIAIRKAREERLHSLLASPTNQHPGTRDTVYSLYQTVAEYLDYETPVRTATGTEEAKSMARFTSAHFDGAADRLKSRAFGIAMELAGVTAGA